MKKQISPIAAVAVVLVVVAVVAIFYLRGGVVGQEKGPPPGMPPDVAAEFAKRLGGGANPQGGTGGASMPVSKDAGSPIPSGGPGSGGMMGGMNMPPGMGAPGGQPR